MPLSVEGSLAVQAMPAVGVPRRFLVEHFRARDIALALEARNISMERTRGGYPVNPAGNRRNIVAQGASESIGCRNLVERELKAEEVTHQLNAVTRCLLTAT